MHTRSAKNKDGKFTVTVWDWNGAEFFKGEFSDLAAANEACTKYEREVTLKQTGNHDYATLGEIIMSDDELLAELMA